MVLEWRGWCGRVWSESRVRESGERERVVKVGRVECESEER